MMEDGMKDFIFMVMFFMRKNEYNTNILSIFNIFKRFKIFKIFQILIISFIIIKSNILNEQKLFFKEDKKKQLKVCLCVIGKKENLYAREFVDYYRKIGYNNIFIYDNNEINDEKFEDVINNEIKEGFVKIINFRGYRGSKGKPQFDAYLDCYEKNNKKYDWLSFFDFDEFLEFKPINIKIQDFLSNNRFKNCLNVKINWLWYINNNSLYYENKPIQERVTFPLYGSQYNLPIKSTIRGNLSMNYWLNMNNPHSSLNNFNSCSSSGQHISYSTPFINPPDYKYAILKHYHNKSFEEYCRKILRGRADTNNANLKKIIQYLYENNKYNKKKLNIMKRIFNISFHS